MVAILSQNGHRGLPSTPPWRVRRIGYIKVPPCLQPMLFLSLTTYNVKVGRLLFGALGGEEAPPMGECVPRPMAPSVHRWEAGVD